MRARRQDDQIPAARGACQQHAFQRHGPHDAALDMREHHRQRGGAEELRDGGEAAPDGAMLDGLREVAPVSEEDLNDVEHTLDTLRHGFATLIRLGIRSGSKASGGECGSHSFVYLTNFGAVI